MLCFKQFYKDKFTISNQKKQKKLQFYFSNKYAFTEMFSLK